MLASLEECVERLDYNSPELCILDKWAYVCSLLSQRKGNAAGIEERIHSTGLEMNTCPVSPLLRLGFQ